MSEQSLDKLIDTLKTEAIEAAEKQEKDILDRARAKAEQIVREAEAHKEEILAAARQEADAIIHKGEHALTQAARDVVLRVQNDLRKLFGSVLERDIQSAFDGDLLKKAILQVLDNIDSEVTIQLPPDLEDELTDFIQKQVQSSGDLAEVTTDDSLVRGFSIKKTDQGWSYQVTPEEVSAILTDHLSHKWASIIQIPQTA